MISVTTLKVLALETVAMVSSCSDTEAPTPSRQEQVERIYLKFIEELVSRLKGDGKLFVF
jgi:hypothetical protein